MISVSVSAGKSDAAVGERIDHIKNLEVTKRIIRDAVMIQSQRTERYLK